MELSLNRTSILILLSLSVLTGAITILLPDSNFNVTLVDPIGRGDPTSYQHMFIFIFFF